VETAGADFWMDERSGEGGSVRLGLVGELDIASASALEQRLRALAQRGDPVVLDLGRLQFIDSSGLRELVRAVSEARRDHWRLELDTALSPQVRQIIELLELHDLFWPPAGASEPSELSAPPEPSGPSGPSEPVEPSGPSGRSAPSAGSAPSAPVEPA
jgi:anti-anti-sigma factor